MLNGEEMRRTLGLKHVAIINDFAAIGYGLLALTPADLEVIRDAPQLANAPKACIGAGTGLGQVYLTQNGPAGYEVWPSEGGHCDFAPRTQLEWELLQFLKEKDK